MQTLVLTVGTLLLVAGWEPKCWGGGWGESRVRAWWGMEWDGRGWNCDGGRRVPASTREQLFNWIQRREGRKGRLVVYEVPAAARDLPLPHHAQLSNPFSKISRQNRFHNPLEEDHLFAHAQLSGAFPILLAEQFNLMSTSELIKIIINVLFIDGLKPFLFLQKRIWRVLICTARTTDWRAFTRFHRLTLTVSSFYTGRDWGSERLWDLPRSLSEYMSELKILNWSLDFDTDALFPRLHSDETSIEKGNTIVIPYYPPHPPA